MGFVLDVEGIPSAVPPSSRLVLRGLGHERVRILNIGAPESFRPHCERELIAVNSIRRL